MVHYAKRSNHTAKPTFETHHSWWAMREVGSEGKEWTVEEKFAKIAAAGYQGLLGRLPEPDQSRLWRRLLDDYGFTFGVEAFPADRGQFKLFLEQAKSFGVDYVNAQVLDSFVTGADAVALLEGLLEEASLAGLPVFVETHRGRITQDLLRTIDYVRQIPQLYLTIDFSHYVVAGEMSRDTEKADPWFEILLERTACIHGRVSNGQQIQIDIGPEADHPMTNHFARWWETGMRQWLAKAEPGDMLPFVCELGPRPYAIARYNGLHVPEQEISDRWEQGLVIKRLAEDIWSKVVAST